MSWHQDGIFFARMGMIEEALEYNKSKLADSPRRSLLSGDSDMTGYRIIIGEVRE